MSKLGKPSVRMVFLNPNCKLVHISSVVISSVVISSVVRQPAIIPESSATVLTMSGQFVDEKVGRRETKK